jgi:PhnB protein
MAVKPIPDGYGTITPYLIVKGASKLVDFMKQAFGGEETMERFSAPDGSIMHTEVRIGTSIVMVSDANAMHPAMPAALLLYVTDCDAVYKRAIQAGGTVINEPADQFYGDRSGGLQDPSGNMWWVATHKEDVPPEEMKRRASAMMKEQGRGA